MSISERLRKAMKEAGFQSQMELERASGVKQPTINRILNRVGSKGPESETVKQLARACGVSFEWLNEGLGIEAESTDVHVSAVPEVDRQFGRRVKAAREAAGLTQTELGVRMNISPQGVQKWESGAGSPRFSRLYGLASVLGPLCQTTCRVCF
ncbi:helix-turn-helix domain-containing protein [Massilia sp. TWP1-3-3]|uniref:helix-turn-helix domain-containing protein n=1 Tax=Massilia sp. TWP1-3-3 TaxID=2804573 RepID=UPI003CF0B7CB